MSEFDVQILQTLVLLNATLTTLNATLVAQARILAQLVHDENNHATVVIAGVELLQQEVDAFPRLLKEAVEALPELLKAKDKESPP